jgi:nicotinate-nucleotide pyrophosphorylase (carboxylating)
MDMYSLTTETGALIVAGGLNPLYIEDVIENTILEDLDGGIDVTSVATVPFEQRSTATFGTRADGCVSGLVIAAAVIEQLYASAQLLDGSALDPAAMVKRLETLMQAAVSAPLE